MTNKECEKINSIMHRNGTRDRYIDVKDNKKFIAKREK